MFVRAIMMNTKNTFWWFAFGLGSQLQIVASLSITELAVYVVAPFMFFSERRYMKKNGVMPFFVLSVLVVVGCVVACLANNSSSYAAIRGMAVTTLLPCSIIVAHHMLRKDASGFKWFLLGYAISGVLCTFFFQKAVEVSMQARGIVDDSTAELISSGPLYWIQRIGAFVYAYPQGWYISCPLLVSAVLPILLAVFAMATSVSGRAVAICAIASAGLVLLGGKRASTIKKGICDRFGVVVTVSIIGLYIVYLLYTTSARLGLLGTAAAEKYINQTTGRKGIVGLLLGGRMASFCGLIACVDKPIIGFGPWAFDTEGYTERFLHKYGTQEDYAGYMGMLEFYRNKGVNRLSLIECHSFIVEFWCWYGIFGLLFWLYVLFVFVRYLRQDCYVVPQWYMWLAAGIPSIVWRIFFSPFSDRVICMTMIVACLIARAIRKGKMRLPNDMVREIVRGEDR